MMRKVYDVFFGMVSLLIGKKSSLGQVVSGSYRTFDGKAGKLAALMIAMGMTVLGSYQAVAQIAVTVTGGVNTTPNLSASYASLSLALTAVNNVTAMSGPITLTLTSGNSETAPVKGFVLGSSTLNPVLSSTNTITITKSGASAVTINAGTGTSAGPTAAPDGMFVLNGADYVTIDGITFNDANTASTTVAMEFGIGLFKRVAGDGSNNNTIKNCIINVQRINNATWSIPSTGTVFGTVGILAMNSVYTAALTSLTPTNGGTLATNGTNSGNKFYTNTISGGNMGIALAGFAATSGVGPSPTATTFLGDINNDIGGTGASGATTGNTILNYGGGAATSLAAGVQLSYQWSANVSNNTVNNNNGSGVNHTTTLYGIYGTGTGTSANVTYSYNTITVNGGGTTAGVYGLYNGVGTTIAANTATISNNTFSNCSYTTMTSGTFYFIQNAATAATVSIQNNTITGLTYNSSTTATGTTYFVYNLSTSTTYNLTGNTIQNISQLNSSGSIYILYTSNSTPTGNIQNNTISNISRANSVTSGSMYVFYNGNSPTGTWTYSGNNISNIQNTPTTGTGTLYCLYNLTSSSSSWNIYNNTYSTITNGSGTFYGIYDGYSTNTNVYNNTFSGINTGSTGTFYGIYIGSSVTTTANVYSNTFNNINCTGSATLYCSYIAASSSCTVNFYKNNISDVTSSGATGVVYGLYTSSGSVINVYNNLIGNLYATNSTLTAPSPSVAGIYCSGGTTINAYYNSVYLSATSSGTNFGTAAIYASSTPTLTLRNNNFVNNSTPNGTGKAVAYQRSTTTLTTYGSASNTNNFYTSNAAGLVFFDGTNSDATLSAFKSRLSTRDALSVSLNPTWQSTVSTNPNFLKYDISTATPLESGGANISGYTDDYGGTVRFGNTNYVSCTPTASTSPDIGAWELCGIPLPACTQPSAQATSLVLTPATTSVAISFTAASPVADNYLIVRTTTNVQPTDPVNSASYSVGSSALGGTIVASGSGTSFTDNSAVTASTTYYYWVYAYNQSNSCSGPVYLVASPITGSTTTCIAAPVSSAGTTISSTGFTANWASVSGATSYILDISTSSTFASFATGYNGLNVGNLTSYSATGLNKLTTYYYRVRATNGSCFTSNSATQTLTTYAAVPFTESFATSTLPTGWSTSWGSGTGSYNWAPTTADATYGAAGPPTGGGTYFAYLYVFLSSTTYNAYNLTSPTITLSAGSALSYNYYFGSNGSTTPLKVQISTNGGSSFTDIYAHTSSNTTFATSSAISNWKSNTIDLSSYSGNNVLIRFSATSNYSASAFCDMGLDEIKIVGPCTTPASPSVIVQGATGPGTISVSFTPPSSAPDGYMVVRYPKNSSPTAPVNASSYSLNQSIGSTGVVSNILSGSATSFNLTGLSPLTGYDIYVYPYNNTNCTNGPAFGDPVVGSDFETTECPTIPSLIQLGATTGDYADLTSVANILNGCPVTQPTVVQLNADYSPSTEIYPIIFYKNAGASATNTITVRPAIGAGPFTLSGNTSSPIIDFSGATYYTLDGRAGGTGTTSVLNITNTNTAGSAVRFYNDAKYDTIKYLTLTSGNTTSSNGVVRITSAAGSTSSNGNSYIGIVNNNINANGTSPNAIYAVGSTAPADNKSIYIANNNIYNYYSDVASTPNYGILLGGNNAVSSGAAWTITGNSFYQTSARTYNASASEVAAIGGGYTPGGAYNITNNYFGGSAANCGGAAQSLTGTSAFTFSPIATISGGADPTVISGNTIRNYVVSTTSRGTTSMAGINASMIGGNTVTVTNNTVGSATTAGSISYTGGAASIFNPINVGSQYGSQTGGSYTVSNNTVDGITLPGTTNANLFRGINLGSNITLTSISTISGNTIGSAAAGITIASNAAVTGITNSNALGARISNNTITNISSTNTSTSASIIGINSNTSSGTSRINNNVIYNLNSTATTTKTTTSACLAGIQNIASCDSIAGNTIYNLTGSGNAAITIHGIYNSGNVTAANANSIYNLSASTTTATGSTINGFYLVTGNGTYSNNIIRLGTVNPTVPNTINGIYDISATTTSNKYYYNTIYIGGSGVLTTASNTYSFRSANAGTRDIRNNVFVNARSNASTGGKHYGITVAGTTASPSGLTLNYNVYHVSGTGGVFGLYNSSDVSTLAAWASTTYSSGNGPGTDVGSFYGNPNFNNATATTPDLTVNTALPSFMESQANPITTVTTDYAGATRSSSTPDIGAYEFNGISAVPTLAINSITPSVNQCTATPRVVVVTAVSGATTLTAGMVTLSYQINGGTATVVNLTNTSGNLWSATIPAASPSNATVTWSVTVNDGTYNIVKTGTSYYDNPIANNVSSLSTSAVTGSVCTGSSVTLTATVTPASTVSYCAPNNGTTSYWISGFATTGGTSNISLSGAVANSSGYTDLTASQTVAQSAGGTVNFSFTNTSTSTGQAIWVDWNQNGSFEASEQVFATTGYSASQSGSFAVPSTALNGTTRIRVFLRYLGGGAVAGSDACYVYSSTGYVDIKDFAFVVSGGVTNVLLPTEYNWFDGGTQISTGSSNSLTFNAVNNGSVTVNKIYTVTYTAQGCPGTVTGSQSINIIPTPLSPSVNSVVICGAQIPKNATVSDENGFTNPKFRWYTAASGGTKVQDSALLYFAGTISSTTTYHVSVVNPTSGCESGRTPITMTYTTAPSRTISPSSTTAVSPLTFCLNAQSVTLTSTINASGYDLTFSELNNTTGSGLESPDFASGTSTLTSVVTPSVAGSYTYLLEAVNGTCFISDTVHVTVKSLPIITTSTATPASVCSGSSVALVAKSIGSSAGIATVGSSSTTTSTYTAPFYSLWSNKRMQILYTASELSAAGIGAGNITSISFPTTAGTVANLDYTLKIGTTTASDLGTAFASGNFTTVFTAASVAQNAGTDNTISLTTPFVWDGTSNLVVEMCWGSSSSTATLTSTSPADVTAFTSVRYTYNTTATAGSTLCPTTGGTPLASTTRPLVKFGVTNYLSDLTSATSWSWAPGNFSTATATANPTNTNPGSISVNYAVTATRNGCSSVSANLPVTVNPVPSNSGLTISPSSLTQCGVGVPALTASGSGTILWYTQASGGTAVATGKTLGTYSISSTTTFYVALSNGNCESERKSVTVTVTDPDALTVAASVNNICPNVPTTLTVTKATGNNTYSYVWSVDNISGSGLSGLPTGPTLTITPTASGSYVFKVTGTDGGTTCKQIATLTMVIKSPPAITTVSATPSTVCSGSNVALSATSIGIGSGTVTVGAGSTTTSTYTAPFYSLWSNKRMQILYTAAELSALNIVAGNITSISFPTTSGTVSNKDYTLKLGATTATDVSSGFATGSFTTVFTATELVQTANTNNTVSFQTPFYWNGTSNLVVEMCWGDNSTTATLSSTSPADVTSFTSIRYTYNTTATSGTSLCPTTGGTPLTSTTRPKVIFGVQNMTTNITNTLTWLWTPGNLSGATQTVAPTSSAATTTTYTVTATDNSGCTSTSNVNVSVNPIPLSPVVSNNTGLCGGGLSTATVSSAGATKYRWYAAASGGTALQDSSINNYANYISATTKLYVSAYNGICESDRTLLNVVVTQVDTVTISATSSPYCSGSQLSLTAINAAVSKSQSYGSFLWSATPSTGSGISASIANNITNSSVLSVTPTAGGTYVYSVFASDAGIGCGKLANITITVANAPGVSSVSAIDTLVCAGSSTTLNYTTVSSGSSSIGAAPTTYCTASLGGASYALISAVSIGTLSFSNPTPSSTVFYHSNPASGSTTTLLVPGQTYSFSVTTVDGTTVGGAITSVWIDFNRNGTYEATEWVQPFTSAYTGTVSITIPANASVGLTGMRVRSRGTGNTNGSGDACSNFGSGNTEDFTVTIDAANTYKWYSGSTYMNGTTSGFTVSPTINTSYYVIATNAAGCSTSSNSVSVSVSVIPGNAQVTNNNVTQCGTALPNSTASATNATKYRWYDASGTLLQDSSIAFYAVPISATKNLYVTGTNGKCESAVKTLVAVNVSSPAALALTTATAGLCLGSSTSTSVSAATVGNFTSYSWTVSPSSGSGTLPTGTTPTFSPTAVGTYVYTLTGVSGICSNATTFTLTVSNPPGSPVVSVANAQICTNGTTTLSYVPSSSGSTTLGAAPTTYCTSSLGGASYALISAVSIGTLNFSNPTPSSTVFYHANPASGTTTTLLVPGTTYTFSVTTVNGTTTGAAITSVWIDFNRNGTYEASEWVQPSTSAYTATVSITIPSSASVGLTGMRVRSRGAGNTNGSGDACTNFGSGNTEDFTVTIDAANTYSWFSGGIDLNSSSTSYSVSPTTTTSYYLKATNTGGCTTNSSTITVAVNSIPANVVASNNNQQCGTSVPTVTASATYATKYRWYAASTGGTAIQDSSISTYTIPVSTTTDFYVTGTNGTCESPVRTKVTVTVLTTDPISITASSSSVCNNTQITLTVNNTASSPVRNYTYVWSAAPTTGSGLSTGLLTGTGNAQLKVTPNTSGSYVYTVTATDGSCSITATKTVVVNSSPVISTATATSVCSGVGSALTATSSSTGTINWLWTPTSGPTRTGISTISSVLTNTGSAPITVGFTVTATFSANGCATSTSGITATVNPAPSALTVVNSSQCGSAIPTASVSGTNGTLYNWYSAAIGGALLQSDASTTYLQSISSTQSFYVANVNAYGCSSARSMVTATVSGSDPVFASVSPLASICLGDSVTLLGTQSGVANNYSIWKWTANNTTNSGISSAGLTATGSSTLNSVIVKPTSTGTFIYTITATDNTGIPACIQSATVTLTVNGLPTISTLVSNATSNTICSGNTITLTAAGASSYDWLWSNNVVKTGSASSAITLSPVATGAPSVVSYSVTATNTATQCKSVQSITVTTNPSVQVSAITGLSSVCQNGTMQLTNSITGGTWYSSNPSLAFVNSTTGLVSGIGNGGSATITYTGNNQYGCGSSVTKVVTVNPAPNVASISGSTSICYGISNTYTNAASGGSWSVSPSNAGIITNAGVFTAYNTSIASATIKYTVTNAQNCVASTTYTVSYPSNAAGTWTGALNSNTNYAGNWCLNAVPSASTPLVINTVSKQPVLNADLTAASITFDATATLGLGNYTLTLNGPITGLGTLTANGNGNLTINGGSNPIRFSSSANSVATFTVNTSTTLGSALNIVKKLQVNAGTLSINNQTVTLKSTSTSNTAIVGPVGSGATISGKVVVERNIPNGFRAYRDVAAGVYNAGSVFNNWQEGGSYSKAGYGVFITGMVDAAATSNVIDATTGIDKSITGIKSLWNYRNGAWSWITNNKLTNISPYLGYRLLIRGDRTFDLYTTPVHQSGPGNYLMMNSTTLRTTGNLITGDVKYDYSTGVTNSLYSDASIKLNATDSSYSSIANPYFSIVDWVKVKSRSTGISDNYWYLDPTIGVSGAYQVYNAIAGPIADLPGRYIQPGQAIFVQSIGSTPSASVTFTEADKVDTIRTGVFGRTAINKLSLTLSKNDVEGAGTRKMDIANVVFNDNFSNGHSMEDATKLNNPSDNLSLIDGGTAYMIDGRKPAKEGESIALGLGQLSAGIYTVTLDLSAYNGTGAYLLDKSRNETAPIESNQATLTFEVTEKGQVSLNDRFAIVFKGSRSVTAETEPIVASSYKVIGGRGNVKVTNAAGAKNAKVMVYNTLGQLVASGIMNGTSYVANVGPSTEAYMVKIVDGNGTNTTKVTVE